MYESLCDWGETLCAASPDPTTIITGGASSVVCVWDVVAAKDRVASLKLRQVGVVVLFAQRISVCLKFSSLTAAVRPHGRRDVPGCVRGPHCDRERLPGPHLHPVGPGGAELHHPADGTLCWCLGAGGQRPHSERPFSFGTTSARLLSFQTASCLRKEQFGQLTDTQIKFYIFYCIY